MCAAPVTTLLGESKACVDNITRVSINYTNHNHRKSVVKNSSTGSGHDSTLPEVLRVAATNATLVPQ
eukprot:m.144088 g.144088  ORF g.144088 m.144088 type:complete len:67 (+) comp30354_c0_seq2:96-296(+)